MKSKSSPEQYVAFLRGINVGGHHKVPMARLRTELEYLNFENVVTLLNTGNIIFETGLKELANIESTISKHLENTFGFPIPTIVRRSRDIRQLILSDPFKDVTITSDIRLYVTFLRGNNNTTLTLPWTSDDNSFKILDIVNNTILSVLDLSITKTPKGMEAVERIFSKDITTRNWNTIKRIDGKLPET